MSKGFGPAISGSIAQSERLDTIANNIANSDTNGFKRDQVAFRSVMSSAITAAQKEDIPRKAYTEKDFHRLDGADTAYVITDGTFTDFSPGRIKVTGNPLDVALEGKGKLPFTKTKDESQARMAFSVTLAVMPDYLYDGVGLKLDGVKDGKPAQVSGLLKGDIITKMGELEVPDMQSYMKCLSIFKPGQTIDVKFQREGKEMIKSVTF